MLFLGLLSCTSLTFWIEEVSAMLRSAEVWVTALLAYTDIVFYITVVQPWEFYPHNGQAVPTRVNCLLFPVRSSRGEPHCIACLDNLLSINLDLPAVKQRVPASVPTLCVSIVHDVGLGSCDGIQSRNRRYVLLNSYHARRHSMESSKTTAGS